MGYYPLFKPEALMAITSSGLSFREILVDGYEQVVEVICEESGLHAIIAIHDTRLGPAVGGTRAYPYAKFDDALNDVLRLSRGMTYKAAVAQTGTGGGKSVIIVDHKKPKPEKLLFAFAEAVNAFNGTYICAEDMGMPLADLGIVSQKTRYAVGLPHPKSSGDPSPFTVWGGILGIQAVCKKLWGSDSLQKRKVAIQGLGSTGMKMAQNLFWMGAEIVVADLDSSRTSHAAKLFGATVVSIDEILSQECDILAPCAVGGILTSETIPQLRCQAVAGLANNQLLETSDGDALKERGILHAPDFVINGGGLYNVCVELYKEGYNPVVARQHVERIYSHLLEIFALSETRGLCTEKIAIEIAENNLDKGIGKRTEEVTFHH